MKKRLNKIIKEKQKSDEKKGESLKGRDPQEK